MFGRKRGELIEPPDTLTIGQLGLTADSTNLNDTSQKATSFYCLLADHGINPHSAEERWGPPETHLPSFSSIAHR